MKYEKPKIFLIESNSKANCHNGSSPGGVGGVVCDSGITAITTLPVRGCFGGNAAIAKGYCAYGTADSSTTSTGCLQGNSVENTANTSSTCNSGNIVN